MTEHLASILTTCIVCIRPIRLARVNLTSPMGVTNFGPITTLFCFDDDAEEHHGWLVLLAGETRNPDARRSVELRETRGMLLFYE